MKTKKQFLIEESADGQISIKIDKFTDVEVLGLLSLYKDVISVRLLNQVFPQHQLIKDK